MSDIKDFVPVIVAIIAGAATGIGGIVAWRRLKPESESLSVNTANTVVAMVRKELDELNDKVENLNHRVAALETEIGAWKAWSNRALDVIDRLLTMLDHNERKKIEHEVEKVKRARPGAH